MFIIAQSRKVPSKVSQGDRGKPITKINKIRAGSKQQDVGGEYCTQTAGEHTGRD